MLVGSIRFVSLVFVTALDAADRSLLGASYPLLRTEYGWSPKQLGAIPLFQNLVMVVALPLCSIFIRNLQSPKLVNILSCACLLWGVNLLLLADVGDSFKARIFLRVTNGLLLSCMLPISQRMMVETVEYSELGKAYGISGAVDVTCSTLCAYLVIYFGDWRSAYRVLGVSSIICSFTMLSRQAETSRVSPSHAKIFHKIWESRPLRMIVLQGVVSSIPWNATSFIILLFSYRGFGTFYLGYLTLIPGLGGALGNLIGGILVDIAARTYGIRGRILVCMFSTALGIVFWSILMTDVANTPIQQMLMYLLFQVSASWARNSNKPLVSEFVQSPADIAQVLSVWMLLERITSAIIGTPMVGILSEILSPEGNISSGLAFSLSMMGIISWSISLLIWLFIWFELFSTKPLIIPALSS